MTAIQNPGSSAFAPRARVLLLEDDPAIAKTVVYALEREGLQVLHCLLVSDALRQLQLAAPDVLVLDVGLPDGNGLDVCRAVRAHPDQRHLPVLVLSAQGEEIDRVLGLELGADDYVTKPFSPRELVARVRALLRRAGLSPVSPAPTIQASGAPTPSTPDRVLRWGSIELHEADQRASLNGQWLPLTRRELGLLAQLMRQPGRIHSRESLLLAVWGHDTESTDRTVDTHIKTLRAKLQQVDPACDCIATHRGMGYGLAAAVAG